MQIKRVWLWGGFLCMMLLWQPGCRVVDNATGVNKASVGQSLKQSNATLTRKELSLRLRRLAMSYLGDVPEVCEKIAASDLPLDKRLLALRIRANSADSVIAIAADPDPQVAMLNMVTVLTLQRILAEQRGEEFFGDYGRLFVDATRRMEEEVWRLAVLVLDEDELKQLRGLIVQYRNDYPDEVYVWWVRFSEFSGYKEQFSIVNLGRSIVDLFVPVGDAVAGIETTTDVAERATWLAARQSLIVQWRVELTYLQALSAPETERLLNDIERVAGTIDALPKDIAKEREAILQAIEEQDGALSKLIRQSQAVVEDVRLATEQANEVVAGVNKAIEQADQSIASAKAVLPETESALAQLESTSESLNETIRTLDTFTRQFESTADEQAGRPFDIREYTQAVEEAGKTAAQLNQLVTNLDQSTDPQRLDTTLAALQRSAKGLIWLAGAVALAVGLILIVAAKWLILRKTA